MNIPAGAKISADLLSDALPLTVMAVNDTPATNTTTQLDAAGLVLPLAASSTYLLDGYLAYTATVPADIRLTWSAPDGWAGNWSWLALAPGGINSTGDMNAVNHVLLEGVGLNLAGSDLFGGTLAAALRMYLATDATAGNLQLRFAQLAAAGTPTVVRQGSWLRAQKVT
jgi:hypothetical protein